MLLHPRRTTSSNSFTKAHASAVLCLTLKAKVRRCQTAVRKLVEFCAEDSEAAVRVVHHTNHRGTIDPHRTSSLGGGINTHIFSRLSTRARTSHYSSGRFGSPLILASPRPPTSWVGGKTLTFFVTTTTTRARTSHYSSGRFGSPLI